MGNLGSVKVIKNFPRPQIMLQNIREEIIRQLTPVAKRHVAERKQIVSDFDTKIVFGYRLQATAQQVTMSIVVENSDDQLSDSEWTVGDLWKSLDKTGTAPHEIKPKNPNGALRFLWGGPGSYNPHTRPIARYGGPGEVQNGETVYRKKVNHPGTKPRKFSESINARLKEQFEKAVSRGLSIGAKKR